MSTQVTITLPDEVYQRAEQFARLANRDIASVLAETIELSIPSVSTESATVEAISSLSDEEVLALTQLQMKPAQDARLSMLLDFQQAGILTRDNSLLKEILQ